jgi:hypothetical protein
MHIEILKHPIKGFQVRIVYAEGRTYGCSPATIESARRAARAWIVAFGDFAIEDKSGMKEAGRAAGARSRYCRSSFSRSLLFTLNLAKKRPSLTAL